jgi:hypothetical protein
LLDRLPLTFGAYCFDQIKDGTLLFPAEKSYFKRLFALLDRLNPGDLGELFRPLYEVEQKMGVRDKNWPKREFTLAQVDFLNRSPHYPEWRQAVAGVFTRLDPQLEEEVLRAGQARLVLVTTPAEIPAGSDRMWLRIRRHGKPLRLREDSDSAALVAESVAGLLAAYRASKKHAPYGAWVIDAGDQLAQAAGDPGVVSLSYQRLEKYRLRLMAEVRRLLETEDIRGPREMSARLKRLKVLAAESEMAGDPLLAEFLRAVLLNGNGTLLINNTFVEWAAVQAVRRARPALLIAAFGVRNKIKPFSSLLIYADQRKSNPIPDQMDTLGSYVDLEVFYEYLWQEFEKYAEYRRNTAYLFAGDGLDEVLVIAPPDFPLLAAKQPLALAEVFGQARAWLGV